jgi:hypothetical protein
MKASRAYIASLGTTGVLVGSSILLLFVVSAIVAFRGWPGGGPGGDLGNLSLGDGGTSAHVIGPARLAADLAPAAAAVGSVPAGAPQAGGAGTGGPAGGGGTAPAPGPGGGGSGGGGTGPIPTGGTGATGSSSGDQNGTSPSPGPGDGPLPQPVQGVADDVQGTVDQTVSGASGTVTQTQGALSTIVNGLPLGR